MTNKRIPRKGIPPLADDEVTLFDFACDELPKQLDSANMRHTRLVLMLLLACAEGRTLNMNKVAQVANAMSEGEMLFKLDT